MAARDEMIASLKALATREAAMNETRVSDLREVSKAQLREMARS